MVKSITTYVLYQTTIICSNIAYVIYLINIKVVIKLV